MADTDRNFELTGAFSSGGSEPLLFKSARFEERMSHLPSLRIEFLAPSGTLEVDQILETMFDLKMPAGPDRAKERHFRGSAISATELGEIWMPREDAQYTHFMAELQPLAWRLTQDFDCRIFQEMKTPDIIMEVASEAGIKGSFKLDLRGTYQPRTYCVQYRESSFAFISRLMEQEGIYYYFDHSEGEPIMVLCDDIACHSAIPSHATILIHEENEGRRHLEDHISVWNKSKRSVSLAVAITDYDFEKSTTSLMAKKLPQSGGAKKLVPEIERYDYPGIHKTADLGTSRALARQDMRAAKVERRSGVCNVRMMAVGQKFKPENGPDKAEFMVTEAAYDIFGLAHSAVEDQVGGGTTDAEEGFSCQFSVIPAATQFAQPAQTPVPNISGLQTAVVVGKSGEEIFTDEFGRIKVQFHWDRLGKNDEKSSCWVRTAMPWTGKSWGMMALPRMGQEVVIQFEEGDPDRPICTGMLYNDKCTPPYALPDNKTQSGIKTNSSLKGQGFHELVFEDKKDAEFVRFQSERDYKQIVKNNAEITIGMEHKDKGDLTETVYRHKTQTLETGDHTYTIKDGEQTIKIKKDKTETIEGKNTLTVTDNMSTTVKSGNQTTAVKMGNISIEAKAGKMDIKAMQKITLTVGGSSITIDPAGVTIKAPTVKVEGQISADVKAPMTTVNANGILTLKGSLTMIN